MRKFPWQLLIIAFWACAGQVSGQDLPVWLKDENVPPPPVERVVDEEGFYSQDREALQRMRTAVKKLELDYGFKIYVIIHAVLIDSSAEKLAGRLQQAWIPDGDGLVIVYESDSRSLGLGRGYETGLPQSQLPSVMPAYEMGGMMNKVMDQTKKDLAPEKYIEAVTLGLVTESRAYFQHRNDPEPEGRVLRLVVLASGICALLLLIALGLALLVRRSGAQARRRYQFSVSDVPLRLGAPFGGGKVTVRRFGPSA